ncbi:MAG: YraN family protein [Patescibacteria group bacterium]
MSENQTVGKIGEDIAGKYLQNMGWKILMHNEFVPLGEIDLIAKTKDGTIVFVEVKTMKQGSELSPEDNMTPQKIKKMKRSALFYANQNSKLVNSSKGWRIDVITIQLPDTELEGDALTIYKKDFIDKNLQHFENVN